MNIIGITLILRVVDLLLSQMWLMSCLNKHHCVQCEYTHTVTVSFGVCVCVAIMCYQESFRQELLLHTLVTAYKADLHLPWGEQKKKREGQGLHPCALKMESGSFNQGGKFSPPLKETRKVVSFSRHYQREIWLSFLIILCYPC